MPSNPHKEELRARRNLNLLLTKALPQVGELALSDVVRECLLNYPVSRRFVERFIKDFYVDTGIVTLKEGILFPVKEEEGDNNES